MTNFAALSLEILVAGITATIWLILIIARILIPNCQVEVLFYKIYTSLSVGDLLIFSVLIYNLGWIVHHLGEKLLEPLFQAKWRRKYFSDREFYKIRTHVFQKASDSTMEDIKFDRHVLRISRCNVFNFFVLAVVSIFYLHVNETMFVLTLIISIIIVIISFSQWRSRCEGTFKKFKDIYNSIDANEGDVQETKSVNQNSRRHKRGLHK